MLCFFSPSWLEYATPKWVFDAGAKGIRFSWAKRGPDENGNLVDPVFDDPVYLEKLENFLMAAGKRYAGNPNIAFIDVGTFGLWGEGHTGFSSHLTPEETVRVVKTHIDVQLDPMTPDERRVVHNTLSDWEHIKTESSGEGADRAVTIKYVD